MVGEVTFSKPFGFVEAGTDDGSVDAIDGALFSASWVGQIPWVFWLNHYLTPIIGNHLALISGQSGVLSVALREIQTRVERGTDRRDMLGMFYDIQKEKPTEMTDEKLTNMALSNVFAGTDTTAISLRAILYYLGKNPDKQAKLVAEIDERKANGNLSFPVKLQEAEAMPYLQACM